MKSIHRKCMLFFALFFLSSSQLLAQDIVVLQLAMHDSIISSPATGDIIDDFEAEHAGIQVQLVPYPWTMQPSDLEQWHDYLSHADVVYIESGRFDTGLSRAQYLLDLQPLYAVDSLEAVSPMGEDSFVWDGGRWGIPISTTPMFLNYDSAAFDAIGLSHPAQGWTLSDLQFWATSLAEAGESSPIFIDEEALNFFLRTVLATNLYDSRSLPIVPDFHQENIAEALGILNAMWTDGLIEIDISNSFDESPAPIYISPFGRLTNYEPEANIPLGIAANGFAISRGSDHSEEAYELIRHLVQDPRTFGLFGMWPVYTEPNEEIDYPPYAALRALDFSEAIRYPETLFVDEINHLIDEDEPDFEIELLEAETRLNNRLEEADSHRSDNLVVNPAEPRSLPEDGINLRFGVFTNLSPLPTQGVWNLTAEAFLDANPDIASIEIEAVFDGRANVSNMAQDFDCFYTPITSLSEEAFSSILPLSPLMDVDPNFDRADFIAGTLEQVTRDNLVWAFPMDIQPMAMWINDDFMTLSGLDRAGGWSGESFFSTINSVDSDRILITTYESAMTHLLLWVYALDGSPFDYSVYPSTADFSSPETLEAVRTILNLADAGRLDYIPLNGFADGGTAAPIIIAPMDNTNTRNGSLVLMAHVGSSAYQPYIFPRGENYKPISYDFGSAYISAQSQWPEACYRFLTYASQEPSLWSAMPARHSVLENPNFTTLRSAESIHFYQSIAQSSQDPETIVIPSSNSSSVEEIQQLILYRAFDLVVEGELALEAALSQAQAVIEEFQLCLEQNADADTERLLYDACYPDAWIFGD